MRSSKNITVSVVIPAYNEESNFNKGKINEAVIFLKKQKFTFEIIIVNDGSTDKSPSLLKGFARKNKEAVVLNIDHGGKMTAVKAGVKNAKGEFVLFTDFDQSTPISEILKVLKEFQNGADVVIGKRKKIYGWPLPQRIRSKIFNLLVQIVILPGLSDTQCGFKAFRTTLGQNLFSHLLVTKKSEKGRYMGAFDVELLFLAKKTGYKIKSVDVSWFCVRAGRVALTEPLKMFVDIVKIKIYYLLGRYNKLLAQR